MARDDRLFVIIGCCLVLIVGGAAAVLWYAENLTGEGPTLPRVEVQPIKAPKAPVGRPEVLPASHPAPSADPSDELLRSLITGISAYPAFASLLVRDDLIRRFVASVNLVAGGFSPRDELEDIQPAGRFLVREEADSLVIAAGSYRRYDTATEIFDSIDTEGAVETFRRLETRLDEAYHDMAWGRGPFEDRLREAIDHLLEVVLPAGLIEVERRSVTYAFAEDELERLTGAQRHLLRTGTRNATTIQSKLREIREAFGWPEPQVLEAAAEAVMIAAVAEPAVVDPWRFDPSPELAEIIAETGLMTYETETAAATP
jgi:hypothetical protein